MFSLETSTDDGATWAPLPFEVRDRSAVTPTDGTYTASGDRRWVQVRADLAAGRALSRPTGGSRIAKHAGVFRNLATLRGS